jgi:dihydroorotate dehydrogenase electron transfer subunit
VADASWLTADAGTPVRVEAEIIRNRPEGRSSWRLVLRVPGWPGFQPGQFAMLSAGALGGAVRTDPLLPRPMAIYRAEPGNGSADVEILYRVVGRGTALLADALQGQRVGFVGPLGRAFPRPRSDERVIIVAGGTGIASVYDLAAQLAGSHPVEILFGARTATDLMAIEDFEALEVTLRTATEDGSVGTRGLVTELLESALDEVPNGPQGSVASSGDATVRGRRVYTCGPTAMMKRCAELAAQRGVPCIAALENVMACGFGVCLGCATPLKRGGFALVCCDGPAFDAESIDWERLS